MRRPTTILIGEMRRPIALQTRGCVELLGVRFRPGAIGSFLDTPVAQIADSVTDSSPLARSLSRSIERTVHAADPADRRRLLQIALANHVKKANAGNALVSVAVRALAVREGCVRIDSLATAFDVSRRQLERDFVREVGIAPKTFAGVLRFRRVLRETEKLSADWAGIAADCGYYDQSHLIRDFKRFTGLTPTAYQSEVLSLAKVRVESTVDLD